MYKTIAALMLVSLTAFAQTDTKPIEFTLQPLTQNFSVLGAAKGGLAVEGNTGCMIVVPVKLSRPQVYSTLVHVTRIRFGIAIQNGRNDWKPIAFSQYWPLNINVSSKQETTVDYAIGCFRMPDNLVAGQYWLFMQINFDDVQYGSSSTYAATEEYWQLIDVPKDLRLIPVPSPLRREGLE